MVVCLGGVKVFLCELQATTLHLTASSVHQLVSLAKLSNEVSYEIGD